MSCGRLLTSWLTTARRSDALVPTHEAGVADDVALRFDVEDGGSSRGPPPVCAAALKFFDWSYTKGGKMAEDLDYIPMPAEVVIDIEKMWSSEIKDASGKPLFSPPR